MARAIGDENIDERLSCWSRVPLSLSCLWEMPSEGVIVAGSVLTPLYRSENQGREEKGC